MQWACDKGKAKSMHTHAYLRAEVIVFDEIRIFK